MNTSTTRPVSAHSTQDTGWKPRASDTAALLEFTAGHGQPRTTPGPDGAPYTLLPPGWTCQELPRDSNPPRPHLTAKLRDAASFVDYFNTHKGPESRIYASLQPARFLAVLDDIDSAADGKGWRQFRADFTVPASREWGVWNGAHGKRMTQLEFAEFLQDNLPDVLVPDGAALLEMALRFEASQAGNFVAAQRLQDGSHDLQWKADNNASGTVKLPEQVTLRLPVFENTEPVDMQARLRYRLDSGRLTIWFELVRPHKVMEAAFRSTWAFIKEACGEVIYLGAPE